MDDDQTQQSHPDLPSATRFFYHELVQPTATTKEGDMCGICREDITDGVTLSCTHKFDAVCIFKWLESADTCPMCRKRLFSDRRFPRRQMNEKMMLSRRECYQWAHDPPKLRVVTESIIQAVPGTSEDEARYAIKRAYDSIVRTPAPPAKEECLMVFEDLRLHLAAMKWMLVLSWPEVLPVQRLSQLETICTTIHDLLRDEWRDQEGPAEILLGWDWFWEAVWHRTVPVSEHFNSSLTAFPGQDWFDVSPEPEPPGPRDPPWQTLDDGSPTPVFYQWMLSKLFIHLMCMSTRL